MWSACFGFQYVNAASDTATASETTMLRPVLYACPTNDEGIVIERMRPSPAGELPTVTRVSPSRLYTRIRNDGLASPPRSFPAASSAELRAAIIRASSSGVAFRAAG